MQSKNACNICYKKFTRKWNLERHLYDIHEFHNNVNNARRKQGIEVPDHLLNMVEPNRKILKKEDNNMNHTQYNQSYYNNNNLPNNSPYYYYGFDNNTSSDLYSNINSQYKEDKKRLSIDDKIKIQKVLKNLENYLKKYYPHMFIFRILSWLYYQCLTQKSDEPLKKFLVQKNIGFLWQF
jgi:hypothetical protein